MSTRIEIIVLVIPTLMLWFLAGVIIGYYLLDGWQ
jgi:hypothetical protein